MPESEIEPALPPPAEERRPRAGERIELRVERLDTAGRGVGPLAGGRRVAVRGAAPGSRVQVLVTRSRGRRLEGRLLRVLEAGPHGVPARCEHFGTCGGCAFQTLAYPAQLEELARGMRRVLDQARLLEGIEPADILGAEDPWHYRNKMDFTFASRRWIEPDEPEGVDASFALGLHVPGRFDKVLDLRGCAIHFEGADDLLATARSLAREQGLEPWGVRSHRGLLRHLVLRAGRRTGEVMVNLVTSREAADEIEPYAEAFLARHPEVTTFVQSVNTRRATIAVGQWQRVLHGPGVIHEELGGLRFTISAGSFFQTHTAQAERLVEVVREEARALEGGLEGARVYDLYCGAGTLGLCLARGARGAREVWGFESVASALEDARRNAAQNGLENVHLVAGDVLASLGAQAAGARPRPDLCVVDPPRAGLAAAVIPALVRLAPRRILYVSCNLAAAARDLPYLIAGGYRLESIRPIDLFPHTPHLECVFTLSRGV